MDSLVKRLQEADRGSAELDYLMEQETGDWVNQGGGWRRHKVTGAEERYFGITPPVTQSLDAIVALIGEKLPGQFWAVSEHPDGFIATIGGPFASETKAVTFGTAPLALCLALLTALQSQEPTPDAK